MKLARIIIRLSVTVLGILTVAACPANDTSGEAQGGVDALSDPSRATAAGMASFCEALCDLESCEDGADIADCVADCNAEAVLKEHLSEAFVQSMAACCRTLMCGDSEDECFGRVALSLSGPPAQVTASCMSRREACIQADPQNRFADDLCASLGFLNDISRMNAAACLGTDVACVDLADCLETNGAFQW